MSLIISWLEILTKWGVIAFVVREFVTGIRSTFRSRANDVHISECLVVEIRENKKRIIDFCEGVDSGVAKNKGKLVAQWTYRSNFVDPMDIVFNSNASSIFSLFNKYDSSALQNLIDFYSKCKSASALLNLYRNRYMGNDPLAQNTTTDPHVHFQAQYRSMALRTLDDDFNRLKLALEKIKSGNKYWAFFKRPKIYKTIAILLGLLLIFIPEREAI